MGLVKAPFFLVTLRTSPERAKPQLRKKLRKEEGIEEPRPKTSYPKGAGQDEESGRVVLSSFSHFCQQQASPRAEVRRSQDGGMEERAKELEARGNMTDYPRRAVMSRE